MNILQRTGLSFVPPGGARSLHLRVVSLVLVGVAFTAHAAAGQTHKARLSRDLDAVVRGTASAPAGGVDVIVSGNADRIQRIASRHNATIKKSITAGAVLTVSRAQLVTMADDSDLGTLSGDGTMHADMALVTRTTGAEAAWHGQIRRLGRVTGRGVGVAIIDSGVDYHTALAGRVVARMDFTGRTPRPGGRDEYGHGTHVAGIVAAGLPRRNADEAAVGMAPDAHLVSLKVLGADGSGKASDVIEAIDWTIAHKDQYRLRIINLSLGMAPTQSYKDDPVCQAVERAVKAGLVVIASAGNHGQTADGKMVFGSISSPGISPFAITVGALRTNGTDDPSDDYVAPWSSKGPTHIDRLVKPDIAAPGSKVVSLLAGHSTLATEHPERIVLGEGRNGYFELSGTSQAAAVVSGAAALVLQARSDLNPLRTKVLLQANADFLPSEGLVGAGAGTLDLTAYSQAIVWGDAIVWGESKVFTSARAWSAAIVWGDAIVWSADAIVWGDDAIVWGDDAIVWGDDAIVWGDDAIVWGDDAIVWGDNAAIVWGDDAIVWGDDAIVWGDDAIVWGDSLLPE